MGDIVQDDHDVAAFVIPAAKYDMTLGMPRVEVIGCDPVELRAEVLLHLPHQAADEGLQVGQVRAIPGAPR
ncbi:hypothetical protein DXU07_29045 [Bradyrhizobium elkanii]|nr:hypothetical protein BLN97_20345 [Bradyrhizobium elkanii]